MKLTRNEFSFTDVSILIESNWTTKLESPVAKKKIKSWNLPIASYPWTTNLRSNFGEKKNRQNIRKMWSQELSSLKKRIEKRTTKCRWRLIDSWGAVEMSEKKEDMLCLFFCCFAFSILLDIIVIRFLSLFPTPIGIWDSISYLSRFHCTSICRKHIKQKKPSNAHWLLLRESNLINKGSSCKTSLNNWWVKESLPCTSGLGGSVDRLERASVGSSNSPLLEIKNWSGTGLEISASIRLEPGLGLSASIKLENQGHPCLL